MKIIFLLITLFAFANGGEEFDKKIGRKAIEEIEEDSGLRIQDSYITVMSFTEKIFQITKGSYLQNKYKIMCAYTVKA